MGTSSTKGLRRSETISDTANNIDSTFIRSFVAIVCGCFPRCSQCSASAGETRQSSKEAIPIYFVSKVLSPLKINYTELEKVLYVVLMASRKLRHYFQSYLIIVPSSQPLKDIIKNREATG
jgi:hypothetical protein